MIALKRNLLVVTLISTIFSCSLEDRNEVVLSDTFFQTALQLSKYNKVPIKKDSELYEQFHSIYKYGQIDSCYVDSLKRIRMFKFQIDSGFWGYAEVKYDSKLSKILNIYFYNRFDVGLKKTFIPSAYLSYYRLEDNFVYDSFYDKLFVIKKRFAKPIEKGIENPR